jgi:apolipoprotein N-acyltransferase
MVIDRGKKTMLALLAGVALASSMPGLGLGPLVFIALVPLLIALEGTGGVKIGFIAGLSFFALDLRWLLTLFRFSPLIVPGYPLLIVYLALYLAAFGFLINRPYITQRSWTLLVLAPVSYTLLEILKASGPLGIGFSSLYHALYRFPALIQISSFIGPWGLTLAIVFINVTVYLALRRHPVFIFVGVATVGLLAACSLIPIPQDESPLDVAVVSSDVRQEVKLDSQNLYSLLRTYLELGEEAASTHPDLIVFPESILPTYILHQEEILSQFAELAQRAKAYILFGTGDLRNHQVYNSVVLLSPDGTLAGRYDMVHPVPFGEIIPARNLLEKIGFAPLISSFLPQEITAGDQFTPIEGFGTPICFESTFPAPARILTQAGASLLVTVTNDAWFARSSALTAHFASTVFRAVETGRYTIQAANGGTSGVIDPRGRILEQITGEGVLTASVSRRTTNTFYTEWGNAPLYTVFGLGGLCLVVSWIKDKRKR